MNKSIIDFMNERQPGSRKKMEETRRQITDYISRNKELGTTVSPSEGESIDDFQARRYKEAANIASRVRERQQAQTQPTIQQQGTVSDSTGGSPLSSVGPASAGVTNTNRQVTGQDAGSSSVLPTTGNRGIRWSPRTFTPKTEEAKNKEETNALAQNVANTRISAALRGEAPGTSAEQPSPKETAEILRENYWQSVRSAQEAAAEDYRNRTIRNPEWMASLRSPEDIRKDLDEAQSLGTKAGNTLKDWGEGLKEGFGVLFGGYGDKSSFEELKRYQETGEMPEETTRSAENRKRIDALKEELRISQWAKYEKLRDEPDFAEKSQYKPQEQGEQKYNVIAQEFSFDWDPEYEAINGNETARNQLSVNATKAAAADGTGFLGQMSGIYSKSYLNYMDKDEIALYNYLYSTDKDRAREYIDTIRPDLERREMDAFKAETAEEARAHPIYNSAASVFLSPLKGLSFVGQAVDYLATGAVNENAPYNRATVMPNVVRQTVGGMIEEKWGPVGSSAYSIGMSMADFVWNSVITGTRFIDAEAFPEAFKAAETMSLAIMGSGAAADKTLEAKERGLDDTQAMILGSVAGFAEIFTERHSIETLFNNPWEKKELADWLKRTVFIGQNIAAEASEEFNSDLINWFADDLVSMDKSEWQQSIKRYKKNHPGAGDRDAFLAVFWDRMKEGAFDALAGGISGGVMAGGNVFINDAGNAMSPVRTHNEIAQKAQEDGADYLGELNGNLWRVATSDLVNPDANTAEAALDFVDGVARFYPKAPVGKAIDFVNEVIRSTDNASDKSVLVRINSYLRNNNASLTEQLKTRIEERNASEAAAREETAVSEEANSNDTNTTSADDIANLPRFEPDFDMDAIRREAGGKTADQGGERTNAAEAENSAAVSADGTGDVVFAPVVRPAAEEQTSGAQMRGTNDAEIQDGNALPENRISAHGAETSDGSLRENMQDAVRVNRDSGHSGAQALARQIGTNADTDMEAAARELYRDAMGVVAAQNAGAETAADMKRSVLTSVTSRMRNQLNAMRQSGTYSSEEIASATDWAKAMDRSLREINRGNLQYQVNALSDSFKNLGFGDVVIDDGLAYDYTRAGGPTENAYYNLDDRSIHVSPYIDSSAALASYISHEAFHGAVNGPDGAALIEEGIRVLDKLSSNEGVSSTGVKVKVYSEAQFVRSYSDQLEKVYKLTSAGREAIDSWMRENPGRRRSDAFQAVYEADPGRFWSSYLQDGNGARNLINEERVANLIEQLALNPDNEILERLTGDAESKSWIRRAVEWIKDFLKKLTGKSDPRAEAYRRLVNTFEDILAREAGDEITSERENREGPALSEKSDRAAAPEEIPESDRFRMSREIERVGELVAVHNLTEEQLVSSLELGGFAAPSIAVIKAETGHSKFGPVSVVFGASRIDPSVNRKNKIYGGDAFTPVFPKIGYELDAKTLKRIRKTVQEILGDEGRLLKLDLDADNVSDSLQRNNGSFADAYANDLALRYAFLKDAGLLASIPTREKQYTNLLSNDSLRLFNERFDSKALMRSGYQNVMAHEPQIRKFLHDEYERTTKDAELADELYGTEALDYSKISHVIYAASQLASDGSIREQDPEALRGAIRKEFDRDGVEDNYRAWLEQLGEGIVSRKGVRNNKDYFTPSGNARSFGQLYDEYTLENIVKAMYGGKSRGVDTIGVSAKAIQSVASPSYKNLDQVRKDSSRLGLVTEEEYEAIQEKTNDRINELLETIYNSTRHWSDNRFIEYDSIAEAMVNAARGARTVSSIMKSMDNDGYPISHFIAEDLRDVYNEALHLPTEYFEAKPERVVGTDEIASVIVPDNINEKTRNALDEARVKYVEYEAGNEDSRLKKLNSLENVRFSVSEAEDENYMDAVEAGDMETAQRMVEQAARKAGYMTRAYHGTPNGTFNVFRNWQYFTEDPDYAARYQSQGASVNYKKTAANPRTYDVYLKMENPFDTRNSAEAEIFWNEFYQKWGNGAPLSDRGLPDWTDGDDLIEFFEENGYDYDSILLDEGGTGGYSDKVLDRGISYVIRDSSQIKSADPVTYDDDGNVIPPSMRFTDSEDIRYSRIMSDEDVVSAVESAYDEYDYVGLRIQYEPFEIGEIDHLSHVWDDNNDTGEELDGICAIKVTPESVLRILKEHSYFGDNIAILGSNSVTYGEDPGEIIMRDAVVTSIVQAYPNSETSGESGQMAEETTARFSREVDPETLAFLNDQDTVKVYRAMQLVDGKLYPPMAAKVDGKWVDDTEIGEWYRADERPDLIDKNGKFKLNKGNGTMVPAAYNPYFHSSASPLNDQFSSAYKRPNLVVVEGSIPSSELTSGYRAEGAKNAVGETKWHSGPVASKLKGDKARRVFLSRWFRVDRIMTDAEVADIIANTLQGEDVSVPSNVVTPSLLSELRERGVRIEDKGDVMYSRDIETDADRQARKLERELQRERDKNAWLEKQFIRTTALGDAKVLSPKDFNDLVRYFVGFYGDFQTAEDTAKLRTDLREAYDILERKKGGRADTEESRWQEFYTKVNGIAENLAGYAVLEKVEDSPFANMEEGELRGFLDNVRKKKIWYDADKMKASMGRTEWRDFRKSTGYIRARGISGLSNPDNRRNNADMVGRIGVDQAYSELARDFPAILSEESMEGTDNFMEDYEKMERIAKAYEGIRDYLTGSTGTYSAFMDESVAAEQIRNDIVNEFLKRAKPTRAAQSVSEDDVTQAYMEGQRGVQAAETIAREEGIEEGRRQGEFERDSEIVSAQNRADIMEQIFREDAEKLRQTYAKQASALEAKVTRLEQRIAGRNKTEQARAARNHVMRQMNRLNNMLENPTRKSHIPQHLRSSVAGLLKVMGNTRLPNGKTVTVARMNEIQAHEANLMRELAKDIRSELGVKGGQDASEKTGLGKQTEEFIEELADKVDFMTELYNRMTTPNTAYENQVTDLATTRNVEFLRVMGQVLDMTIHAVQNENAYVIHGKMMNAEEIGERLVGDLNGKRENAVGVEKRTFKRTMADKLQGMSYEFMSADLFFETMGDNWTDLIAHSYREGQNRQARLEKSYVEYMKNLIGDYSVRKAGNSGEFVRVKIGSKEFNVTRAQLMQLYATWQRPAGRIHLENGGACFVNSLGQEFREYTFPITEEIFNELTSNLTEEEKRIADGLVRFMADKCAEWGNEASMYMYGYRMYEDPNYIPMDVVNYALPQDLAAKKGTKSILNASFTKKLLRNASTPLRMTNIFDLTDDHVRRMASYGAYGPITNDLNRIMTLPGVNEAIQSRMGQKGVKYLKDFIETVAGNQVRVGEMAESAAPLTFLMNAYKRQAVAWNVSTMLKQPISIIRAANEIDAKYLAKGAVSIGKGEYKRVLKRMMDNSGVAYIKDNGYSDIGFGSTLRKLYSSDYLNDSGVIRGALADSKLGRSLIKGYDAFIEAGMKGAGKADEQTWVRIWKACELEVSDKNPDLSGDAYTKKVTERFNDVIGKTQVVDTVLDTAPLMRNKAMQIFTPFMNEPTKSLGGLLNAFASVSDGKPGAKKIFWKAVGLYALSNLVIEPLITTAMTMWRDEKYDLEDWETFWNSFLEKMFGVSIKDGTTFASVFTSNVASGVFSFPILNIVYDTVSNSLQGYGSEKIDVAALGNLVDASKNLYNGMMKSSENRPKTMYRLWGDWIESLAAASGVPLKTLRRQVAGTVRGVADITNNDVLKWEYNKLYYNLDNASARSQKGFYDIMVSAYKRGDMEAYRKFRSELNDIVTDTPSLVSASSIENAIIKGGGELIPGTDMWNLDIQARFRLDNPVSGWKVERFLTSVYKSAESAKIKQKAYDDVLLNMPGAYEYDDDTGETLKMTPAEYDEFTRRVGEFSYRILSLMASSDNKEAWSKLSIDQKVYAIKSVYKYAKASSKKDFDKDYNIRGQGVWMDELYSSKAKPSQVVKVIFGKAREYTEQLER